MTAFVQDLRYAFRHLRHAPGFSISAILILALGIGANVGMFTILNGIALRPIPVHDPDRLVGVTIYGSDGVRRTAVIPVIEPLEREGPFEQICAINGGGIFAVEVNGVPAQTPIASVSSSCFEIFGVQPMLGRTIRRDEAPLRGSGSLVGVISHRFWTRLFGGDPNAVGKTIRVEGVELTVIGVMPPAFVGLQADVGTDLFFPMNSVNGRSDRLAATPQFMGRLKPGVTLQTAQAELAARWPAMVQAVTPPASSASALTDVTRERPLIEALGRGLSSYRTRYEQSIRIIVGLTAVLMLLACVNLGGLLLARVSARGPELSVRIALGSTGWRLAQQMLLESVLLTGTGVALAAPLSVAFVGMLESMLPTPLVEHSLDFSPDTRVLGVMALVGVTSALLVSALPIWLAWRRGGVRGLSMRTVAGGTSRWARGLLVAQVALSLMMVAGATLLTRSLYLLQQVDPGVQTGHVLNVKLMPLPGAYRSIDNAAYYPALLEQIRSLPGVRAAGFARVFPRGVQPVGQSIALVNDTDRTLQAQLESASPGLFETLGVPLLQGRLPLWTDTVHSKQVAIVNESLARKLAPDGDVIGRHVSFGVNPVDQNVEIVGIVGNMSLGNLRVTDFPVFYRPMLQARVFGNFPNLMVSTVQEPLALAPAVTDVLKAGGREYAHTIAALDRLFLESPSNERISASLATVIAALAVALAFMGIYALLAYGVARRTREIGVRLALGGDPGHVVRMVIREGLVLTALGIAIGIPAAAAGGTVLGSQLFGVSSSDPAVLIGAAAFFLLLSVAAGLVPARRAARVDPIIALRAE